MSKLKYVVAGAENGFVYYMDNKLYDHKKQAFSRLRKLSDSKSGLKVWSIKTFNLIPEEE